MTAICDFAYHIPDAFCGTGFSFLQELIPPVYKAMENDSMLCVVKHYFGSAIGIHIVKDIYKPRQQIIYPASYLRTVTVFHGIQPFYKNAEVVAVEFGLHRMLISVY